MAALLQKMLFRLRYDTFQPREKDDKLPCARCAYERPPSQKPCSHHHQACAGVELIVRRKESCGLTSSSQECSTPVKVLANRRRPGDKATVPTSRKCPLSRSRGRRRRREAPSEGDPEVLQGLSASTLLVGNAGRARVNACLPPCCPASF